MADDDWGTWFQNLIANQAGPGMGYPAAHLTPRAAPGTPLGPIPGANLGYGDTTFLPQHQSPLGPPPIGPFLAQPGANVLGSSLTAQPGVPSASAPGQQSGVAPAPIDPFTLRGPSSPAGTSTAAPTAAAAPAVNPAAIPGAPNLGYYRGATGNARQAQWTPYADPNDPRIYRGPLAAPQGSPSATPPVPGARPTNAGQPASVPMPPTMPASIANQRVANAVRSPNWWQNL
jgi:hypothetical protein